MAIPPFRACLMYGGGGAEARHGFEAMMSVKAIDVATIDQARRG